MTDRNHQPQADLLDQATAALRRDAIPAGPPPRLVAKTLETLRSLEPAPELLRTRERRPTVTRIFRMTASAAAALAIAAAWWQFERHASITFAQVIDRVNKTKSVSFVLKQKLGDQPEIDSRIFLRGPMMRYEIANALVMIVDVDNRQGIELDESRKIARKVDLAGRVPAEMLKDPIDRLRRVGDAKENVESLGDEEIDGVTCHVFQVKGANMAPLVGDRFKLWVDAKTRLPFRIEARDDDDRSALIYEKFRWDEDLKEDLFRLDLPAGYMLEELTPAVIKPGRIYYHQGSVKLTSIAPDGKDREVQFVPRPEEGPVTYDSDKSVMTPDGRYVAIAYTHVDDKGAFPPNRVLLWDRVLPKDPAVEIYHRPGGEMQTWQFTPDGQRLYVAYWTADADKPAGRYGADVVDLRTKTTQPVTLPTDTTTAGKSETMYFATTTADGKLYLVVDGGGALHVASSAGKLIRRLTAENTRVNPWRVQLSPDGRQVACVARHVDNSQQLFVVDFSGGESRELVPASVVTDLRAHWSPDGKRLAYSSRSFAPANPPFHFGTIAELKLVDPDGQNPVTLVTEKVHPNGASLELIGWR